MSARWTNKQMEILRERFYGASREELLRELAPHTWDSIRRTAQRANLRRVGERITDWRAICAHHVYQTSYFQRLSTR